MRPQDSGYNNKKVALPVSMDQLGNMGWFVVSNIRFPAMEILGSFVP